MPDSIDEELTKPGAFFEISEEAVLGHSMPVFRKRLPNLAQLLRQSDQYGERTYMVWGKRRFSYKRHLQLVLSAAHWLRAEHGIGPGDRVAVGAANSFEWVVVFWATQALGAVCVGLNGWWAGAEMAAALKKTRPKLVFFDEKRRARLPANPTEEGFGCREVALTPSWLARMEAYAPLGLSNLSDVPEDAPATILFTSGTTGSPKGVVSSQRNILALIGIFLFYGAHLALRTGRSLASGPPPVLLSSNPLFHVSGLFAGVVGHLAAGATSVWTVGRYDAEDVMEIIQREKVSGWSPHGAMAYRLLNHPRRGEMDLSSVKTMGSGGATVTERTQNALREAFPNAADGLGVGYGQTECTALATMNGGPDLRKFPTSVGKPLPTIGLEVRNQAGEPCAEGEVGRVWVRGPTVMLGYFEDEAATSQVLDKDRWLCTGDLGSLVEGRLYLATRERDLILRGAENVYPAEIEARLEQHPQVTEAAAVGVPCEEFGQRVKAWVVLNEAAEQVSTEGLRSWVAETLAYFKVPEEVAISPTPLPRNASGKIMKFLLDGQGADPFVREAQG